MNILVCVKQVPDAEAPFSIGSDGRSVNVVEGAWRLNGFDAFAVEEALRIRAAFPDTTVEALTVGPARASEVLRRAMAMGADRGIHILRPGEDDPLPGEVAALIASAVGGRRLDLILAGVMAEDDMQGQTGPMLAEHLSLPCATAVMAQEIAPDGGTARVERELEGGFREALEVSLPALLTVQSGINHPRYPSLSHVLRSRTQPIEIIHAGRLPVPPRRERIVRVIRRETSGKTLFLAGASLEKAEQLADYFLEKALL